MARRVRQSCLASCFLFAVAFDPIFRWLQDMIIPRNPTAPDFSSLFRVLMLMTLQWLLRLFNRVVADRSFSCLQSGGPNCRAQPESSEMLLGIAWQ